mmetsp:Transcript_10282/g.24687  ORF Transcript_10282/g.24687 Transcript_10282/m.24687 type:complete len:274 (-) Transcript_10282:128-949(-)
MTSEGDFFETLVAMASDPWYCRSPSQQQKQLLGGTSSSSSAQYYGRGGIPKTTRRTLPPRKQPTKIRFSNRVRVLEIPSHETLTKRERKALWYPDPNDDGSNRKSRLRLVMCGMDGLLSDKDGHDDFYDRYDDHDFYENDDGGGGGASSNGRGYMGSGIDERDDGSGGGGDYFDELGYNSMIEARKFPVMAVLAEQGSQRLSGKYDDEFISKIYQQCSRDSIARGLARGRNDREVALKCSGTTSEAIDVVFRSMNKSGGGGRLKVMKMLRGKR